MSKNGLDWKTDKIWPFNRVKISLFFFNKEFKNKSISSWELNILKLIPEKHGFMFLTSLFQKGHTNKRQKN